jgi:hypothetical protein
MKFAFLDRSKLMRNSRWLADRLKAEGMREKEAVEKATKDAAAFAARDLARVTFPNRFGFILAKAAMIQDVRQVYATAGDVYDKMKKAGDPPQILNGFYSAFMAGDYSAAREFLRRSRADVGRARIGGGLDESLHDQARGGRARPANKEPLQIVRPDERKRYEAKAIKRLGKTASGWSACAEILGQPQADGWKSTAVHGFAGAVEVKRSESAVFYVLKNLRPLARRHISGGQVKRVLSQASMRMLGAVKKRAKRKKKVA